MEGLLFPVTADRIRAIPKRFDAVFLPELFTDLKLMQSVQTEGSKQILGARSEDSFNGRRPLTEHGLQQGHILGCCGRFVQPHGHWLRFGSFRGVVAFGPVSG
ncbi:MAG: hypothetical protein ACU85E_15475, partial [Gammaproteobacteria bacterium]